MIVSSANFRQRQWSDMWMDRREPQRRSDRTWEEMRQDYIEEHGHIITIPHFEDIIHFVPDSHLAASDVEARKRRQFLAILGSPQTEWMRSYASVMTALDNIQDAVSTGIVAGALLTRAMPRLLGRLVPFLGWALLAGDILDLLNTIGRAPMAPLAVKRYWCAHRRRDPMARRMRQTRPNRIRMMRPTLGNAIEAGQVLFDATGAGLALGSIMGFISDLAFGAYRHLTGEEVHIMREPPEMSWNERPTNNALVSAPYLTTENPIFDDQTHHLIYLTLGLSQSVMGPVFGENPPSDILDDPLNYKIPALRPTNPITRYVIESEGYDIEAGVSFPANGRNEIKLGDLADWQEEHSQRVFESYVARFNHDVQGFVCGSIMCNSLIDLFEGAEPSSPVDVSLHPCDELMTRFLRTPIFVDPETTKESWGKFRNWVEDFYKEHGQLPESRYAKQYGEILGMKWRAEEYYNVPLVNRPVLLGMDAAELKQDMDSWPFEWQ